MRYTVMAISPAGYREYNTNELPKAEKKAAAWETHGWKRISIHDNLNHRFLKGGD